MVHYRPLGQMLIEAGLISSDDLQQALGDQEREGGLLGQHLLINEALTRQQMYTELAQQWNAPLIDLSESPPDRELLTRLHPSVFLETGWIPHSLANGVLTIATSVAPEQDLLDFAAQICDADSVVARTVTDWDIQQAVIAGCRIELLRHSSEELFTNSPSQSAKLGILKWQRRLTVGAMLALVAAMVLSQVITFATVLIAINLMFLVGVGFKIVMCLGGFLSLRSRANWEIEIAAERNRRGLSEPRVQARSVIELPTYTVLVPAFREGNIIERVIANIANLDYPKSRLQVLVLVEEDDHETLLAAKNAAAPEYVRLLVVPAGAPQTKPRACNFGLLFATGEYLVIYDAEDRPEANQLLDSVDAFAADAADQKRDHAPAPIACFQAALNYENSTQNALTRLFALEYSFWFDVMLPGIEEFRLPLPLGGTSNHFRTDTLRLLGAWDPYNVTEDADLGLRATAAGYRVGVIKSTTWEEACSEIPAWIRQRTRWIKGYMITSLVHLRSPIAFYQAAGLRGVIGLLGLIVGTPAMFLAYPIVVSLTIVSYIGIETDALALPSWVVTASVWNMIVGNLSMILLSGYAGLRRHGWRIALFCFLNPVYWTLHAWAAYRALYQLVLKPFQWEKTPHGLEQHQAEYAPVR